MTTHSPSSEEGEDSTSPIPVLMLYNVVDQVEYGETRDLEADQSWEYVVPLVSRGLLETGHEVSSIPVREETDIVRAVAEFDPTTTLVFNLCENLGGRPQDEARIPLLLEQYGFQYTGSPAGTLLACLDKAYAKSQLAKQGISTPAYQVFVTGDEPIQVPLPAIVKPRSHDASVGIDRESVVLDIPALLKRVRYILDTYHQPALVEAFVVGREFTVSVWGDGVAHTLPLAEIDYSALPDPYSHFLHFDAKWHEDSIDYQKTDVICPALVDQELAERISQTALAAYKAMGCRDYARVDVRVQDGCPYVLEVNPNPCLSLNGGLANAALAAGYSHSQMVHQIVTWAWSWRGKHK